MKSNIAVNMLKQQAVQIKTQDRSAKNQYYPNYNPGLHLLD